LFERHAAIFGGSKIKIQLLLMLLVVYSYFWLLGICRVAQFIL